MDFPDVYGELFSLTGGPFGVVLTLSRIEPTGEAGPHQEPTEVVARIRLSPAAAKAIGEALQSMVTTIEQGGQVATTTIKH